MFGKTKRGGLFGGGIVATPEQEAESARLAQMLGMGGANADTPPVQQPDAQQVPQSRGRGMFGGGTVRAIAGTIGDTLLQHNGMDPVYAPTMQAQQQHAAKQREASLRAEVENAQWYEREQWKRDNPPPTNNDTVADYEFIRQTLGDEEAQKYLQNKADPPQYRQGPDGQFYRVQVGQGVPTAPVGKLTPITGGPTPQASGGFREAFAGF